MRTESQQLFDRGWIPLGLEKEWGLENEPVKVEAWEGFMLGRTATEDRQAGSPGRTPTQGFEQRNRCDT